MKKRSIKLAKFIKRVSPKTTHTLFLFVLLGSTAGCMSLGGREATQAQPSPVEQLPTARTS